MRARYRFIAKLLLGGTLIACAILAIRYTDSILAFAQGQKQRTATNSTADLVGIPPSALGNNTTRRPARPTTTEIPFGSLAPEEQAKNINFRLRHLRDDLASSAEPGALLRSLFQDLDKLDPLPRMAFDGILENELARLDLMDAKPLQGLAEVFPKISDTLKAKKYADGDTAAERVFDLLYTQTISSDVDLLGCIASIDDPETKTEFETEIIPRLIVFSGDSRQEQTDKLSSSIRAEVEQRTMELSAKHKEYRAEAFGRYLRGEGTNGVHQELVKSWFASPDWFWPSSKEIAGEIAAAPPGSRRDEAIAGVIRLVGKSDPESAGQWIAMMSNSQRAAELRAALRNE